MVWGSVAGLGGLWDSMNSGAVEVGVGHGSGDLNCDRFSGGCGAWVERFRFVGNCDAYNGLKALVRRKLAGRPDAELVLARHEQDPQVWEKPLAQELTSVGAGDDPDLVSAAQALMQLVDAAGSAAGKYTASALDHSAAAGRDMTITASGGGTAAGVIHGNVTPPDPTPPGSVQREPPPGQ